MGNTNNVSELSLKECCSVAVANLQTALMASEQVKSAMSFQEPENIKAYPYSGAMAGQLYDIAIMTDMLRANLEFIKQRTGV